MKTKIKGNDKETLIEQKKALEEKIKKIEASEPKIPPLKVEVTLSRLALLAIFMAGFIMGNMI